LLCLKFKNVINLLDIKYILWSTVIKGCYRILFYFQVEEDCFSRRLIPPSLPPAPPDISEQELRRRYIVDDIVRSENSYLATLHRLVNVSY